MLEPQDLCPLGELLVLLQDREALVALVLPLEQEGVLLLAVVVAVALMVRRPTHRHQQQVS